MNMTIGYAAPDQRWDAVTVEFDLRLDGEGMLEWDLQAGRAETFDASCQFVLRLPYKSIALR